MVRVLIYWISIVGSSLMCPAWIAIRRIGTTSCNTSNNECVHRYREAIKPWHDLQGYPLFCTSTWSLTNASHNEISCASQKFEYSDTTFSIDYIFLRVFLRSCFRNSQAFRSAVGVGNQVKFDSNMFLMWCW